jgi:hypothetical protein
MTGLGGAGGGRRTGGADGRAAVDAFLARGDLAASSRRSYAQTLNRLAADVGADRALVMLNADVLGGAVQDAWGGCAPATWNRHVATALARARAVPLAA